MRALIAVSLTLLVLGACANGASTSSASPTAGRTTPATASATATAQQSTLVEYAVPRGSRPHDVAPAPDGGVWYSGQGNGTLGYLDPATADTREVPLEPGSAPHGVIVGPDGAPWITDGGLNAIVRVDPAATHDVSVSLLPRDRSNANL